RRHHVAALFEGGPGEVGPGGVRWRPEEEGPAGAVLQTRIITRAPGPSQRFAESFPSPPRSRSPIGMILTIAATGSGGWSSARLLRPGFAGIGPATATRQGRQRLALWGHQQAEPLDALDRRLPAR